MSAPASPPKQEEEEEEDVAYSGICSMCGKGHANPYNDIVFCDACSAGFHQRCFGLPLRYGAPPGEWRCNACAGVGVTQPDGNAAHAAATRALVTLPDFYNIFEFLQAFGGNHGLKIAPLTMQELENMFLASSKSELESTVMIALLDGLGLAVNQYTWPTVLVQYVDEAPERFGKAVHRAMFPPTSAATAAATAASSAAKSSKYFDSDSDDSKGEEPQEEEEEEEDEDAVSPWQYFDLPLPLKLDVVRSLTELQFDYNYDFRDAAIAAAMAAEPPCKDEKLALHKVTPVIGRDSRGHSYLLFHDKLDDAPAPEDVSARLFKFLAPALPTVSTSYNAAIAREVASAAAAAAASQAKPEKKRGRPPAPSRTKPKTNDLTASLVPVSSSVSVVIQPVPVTVKAAVRPPAGKPPVFELVADGVPAITVWTHELIGSSPYYHEAQLAAAVTNKLLDPVSRLSKRREAALRRLNRLSSTLGAVTEAPAVLGSRRSRRLVKYAESPPSSPLPSRRRGSSNGNGNSNGSGSGSDWEGVPGSSDEENEMDSRRARGTRFSKRSRGLPPVPLTEGAVDDDDDDDDDDDNDDVHSNQDKEEDAEDAERKVNGVVVAGEDGADVEAGAVVEEHFSAAVPAVAITEAV